MAIYSDPTTIYGTAPNRPKNLLASGYYGGSPSLATSTINMDGVNPSTRSKILDFANNFSATAKNSIQDSIDVEKFKSDIPYNFDLANTPAGEQSQSLMQNIQTLGNIGVANQIGSGVLSSVIALGQLLAEPTPMQVRPQTISQVEFQDPSAAIVGGLREQNNQALASGLNQIRSSGGGGTEGLVAQALKNQLGIAQTESEIKTGSINRQIAANSAIESQNAQLSLDYQAYKDEFQAAMQRRRDAILSNALNSITGGVSGATQQASDAMSSIASIMMFL